MQRRVAVIVGTRPEAIKMAPIVRAAQSSAALAVVLVATGQQNALFDAALADFALTADVQLGARAGASVPAMAAPLTDWLVATRPDLVLVQGDTNSALAGALAAAALNIPVGHIEAGLRTHNPERPFPEENNRVAIAKHATLHCAPSPGAAANLRAEDVRGEVHVTGNPGIDALMRLAGALTMPGDPFGQQILVTCHRRENFGTPLRRICTALRAIAAHSGLPLVLPVHPNPNVADVLSADLADVANLRLIAPLSYPEMITAIRNSRFVLSDSGGVQEECAALGVPLLCLREETERPEVVASGNVRLVGSDTARIIAESHRLLADGADHAAMSVPAFPYGRGDAAEKIVTLIERFAALAPR